LPEIRTECEVLLQDKWEELAGTSNEAFRQTYTANNQLTKKVSV